MKKYCLFIFIIWVNNLQAQPSFSMGGNAGYMLTNRVITHSNSVIYKDYRNKNEQFSWGHKFFISAIYKFNPYIGIQTGAGYSQKSYRTIEERIIDPGFSPITAGYSTEMYRYNFTAAFIPAHFIYQTYGKAYLQLSAGASFLFTLLTTNEWILRKQEGKTQGDMRTLRSSEPKVKPFNISTDMGIGFGYKWRKNSGVCLSADIDYQLIANENTHIRDNLYNIGLFMGEDKTTREHLISYGITLSVFHIFK